MKDVLKTEHVLDSRATGLVFQSDGAGQRMFHHEVCGMSERPLLSQSPRFLLICLAMA